MCLGYGGMGVGATKRYVRLRKGLCRVIAGSYREHVG